MGGAPVRTTRAESRLHRTASRRPDRARIRGRLGERRVARRCVRYDATQLRRPSTTYDYAGQDPINNYDLDGRCIRGFGWLCAIWNVHAQRRQAKRLEAQFERATGLRGVKGATGHDFQDSLLVRIVQKKEFSIRDAIRASKSGDRYFDPANDTLVARDPVSKVAVVTTRDNRAVTVFKMSKVTKRLRKLELM